jgi:ssDNA-binding Zn-finger/Zn-ribbon topoisomerase 1
MTTLPCPKCRQQMPDDALDRGQCPACGFPLDGPLVLDAGSRRPRTALSPSEGRSL